MGSWKEYQKLKERKYREESGLFLIEGTRICQEALAADAEVVAAFYSEDFARSDSANQLGQGIAKRRISIQVIGNNSFKKLCNTQNPQGIALVLKKFSHTPQAVSPEDLWLYLDRISDPGNLGTLIRSAAWFGFGGVAISPDSVDLYNPKVVRATMGGLFRLKFLTNQPPEPFFEKIRQLGGNIVGTVVQGGQRPFSELPARPVALVLGSEAEGLAPTIRKQADYCVTIPGANTGESLNIAIAGSILMYELFKETGGKH